MKKISIALCFVLLFVSQSIAGWNSHAYLEYRHGLLSNEPSLIGDDDCPCMGWRTKLGVVFSPFGIDRWKADIASSATGQTKWDHPEVFDFAADTSIRLFKNFSFIAGYYQKHNLDRPAPATTRYVVWDGLSDAKKGWSGVETTYVGFKVDLW